MRPTQITIRTGVLYFTTSGCGIPAGWSVRTRSSGPRVPAAVTFAAARVLSLVSGAFGSGGGNVEVV